MKMQWSMIMPFFVYLVLMLLIGYWANKTIRTVRKTKEVELISEYYLARRSLGPWVLAFTLMATFASAGAFIGAPGQGYSRGFFVVIIGMAASGLTFLLLGGVGNKLAIVSRKIGAVTFPDVLRARFDHPAVGIVSAILIIVFLVAYNSPDYPRCEDL